MPTLIFEAAFDLDVHTFKKSFWNAFLMAVPGIVIAISITLLMVLGIKHLGIGFDYWDWKIEGSILALDSLDIKGATGMRSVGNYI